MKKTKKLVVFIANRMWLIVTIYLTSLTTSTILFSFFEKKSLLEGFWWSCVTALTIGYGDLFPVTIAGKITGVIFSHVWVFGIAPLIVCNIISHILVDKDKFTNDEQEWFESSLKKIATEIGAKLDKAPKDY